MDVNVKINELITLIEKFLENQATAEELNEFSWNVISRFNSLNKDKLPTYVDGEREFWYSIWLIQHLSDGEHERDGTLQRELNVALEYLKRNKKMPPEFQGERP